MHSGFLFVFSFSFSESHFIVSCIFLSCLSAISCGTSFIHHHGLYITIAIIISQVATMPRNPRLLCMNMLLQLSWFVARDDKTLHVKT